MRKRKKFIGIIITRNLVNYPTVINYGGREGCTGASTTLLIYSIVNLLRWVTGTYIFIVISFILFYRLDIS